VSLRHVLFRVARERYALPLVAVREVVLPQPPFARVPRAGSAVRGVMNLRGRVVAVVDMAELMGLEPRALAAGHGQVIILERGKRALGLLIAGVLGVEPVAAEPGGVAGVVLGVASASMGAVTVLAPEELAAAAAALFGTA
jgi:purine-binding chemotaxis protein CheW